MSGNPALREIRRGIEKESLRVNPDGELATTPHPVALGSALTHPNITTDFSEAQLEFITHTHTSVESCLDQLDELHRYASHELKNEYLWPLSMPCMLGPADQIPLAQYGSSNAARIKTIYRSGLGNRYGRLMQTISGIHYNVSFSESFFKSYAELSGEAFSDAFMSASYMHLIRNFRRYSWLLILLFGASPSVCGTFVPSQDHNLEVLDEGSFYRPNATSLRMGPLGYQSAAQSKYYVTYNSLHEYLAQLRTAMTAPYPAYTSIGVEHNGQYEQLNDALLQIEAEFYGPIRPKRKTQPNERPYTALGQRGIEWVEIRCLDIDPSIPFGVDATTLYFVDAFLLHALLVSSPPDSQKEHDLMLQNQLITVHDGGGLPPLHTLDTNSVPMLELAEPLLDEVLQVARLLDEAYQSELHVNAVRDQQVKLANRIHLPAKQLLQAMADQHRTFSQYGIKLAKDNHELFQARPLDPTRLDAYAQIAEESRVAQTAIERADRQPFKQYLKHYMQLPELA